MKNSRFLIGIVIFNLLIGCQPKEQKKGLEAIPVKVQPVQLKDIKQTIEYVGDIKAQDETMVYPKVSGKVITKVKQDGNPISKDEPIIYIDRDEVGLKFEKAPVESPISGVVGRIYVDIGTNVSAQTPVALVVNMDTVKINLDIPERYLPAISLNQEARIKVDAYPDDEFTGRITKISPVVDVGTRSSPVEITLDNPGHRLKSGMFAKVAVAIQEHKDVTAILKEAVIGKEPDTYVYVVKDKRASLQKITLGLREDPYYEVKDGLKQGDSVVVVGQQRLREGAEVIIEEEAKK